MLEFLSLYFKDYVTAFNSYAKEYPMVAGAISLWGLGILTYICRDFPRKIYGIFLRYFTTTITLSNCNDSFYAFLKWYQSKGYAEKGRYVKITNGRWGSDESIKSVGYGNHVFWFNRFPLLLNMSQKESAGIEKEKRPNSDYHFRQIT